eukprot:PhM_4_TR3108/c0_g1_i1/m.23076
MFAPGVGVRRLDSVRGDGVVADRPVIAGETILTEIPMLVRSAAASAPLVCSRCLKHNPKSNGGMPVRCGGCPYVFYCSEECRVADTAHPRELCRCLNELQHFLAKHGLAPDVTATKRRLRDEADDIIDSVRFLAMALLMRSGLVPPLPSPSTPTDPAACFDILVGEAAMHPDRPLERSQELAVQFLQANLSNVDVSLGLVTRLLNADRSYGISYVLVRPPLPDDNVDDDDEEEEEEEVAGDSKREAEDDDEWEDDVSCSEEADEDHDHDHHDHDHDHEGDEHEAVVREIIGFAAAPHVGKLNHSCMPNVARFEPYLFQDVPFPERVGIHLRACKTVAPGTELCISYIPVRDTYTERREYLREEFAFECSCDRCEYEKPVKKTNKKKSNNNNDNTNSTTKLSHGEYNVWMMYYLCPKCAGLMAPKCLKENENDDSIPMLCCACGHVRTDAEFEIQMHEAFAD